MKKSVKIIAVLSAAAIASSMCMTGISAGEYITEDSCAVCEAAENEKESIGISSAKELMKMKKDGVYHLEKDIDLSGVSWKSVSGFKGVLDGNGYEIKGLTSDTYGLFSTVGTGARIRNIKLTDTYITSKYSCVGGIVSQIPSYVSDVQVTDCFVSGVVASCRRMYGMKRGGTAGAVVGQNASMTGTVISDCYSNAVVAADTRAGGIVGSNSGKISRCVFEGYIASSYNVYELAVMDGGEFTDDYLYLKYAGGICAVNSGTVEYCTNAGVLYDLAEYYGGIAGYVQNKKDSSIISCVNGSQIPFDDYGTGGLIAGYANPKAAVEGCYTLTPDKNSVTGDIGKGKKKTVTYAVSEKNFGNLKYFRRLKGSWSSVNGMPSMSSFAGSERLWEIRGARLVSMHNY